MDDTESGTRQYRKSRKFKKEFCDEIVELGRQGKSITQIAAAFGVNRDTIYTWKNDPERYKGFAEAFEQARIESEAYWEDIGQRGILGEIKGFNNISWIFMMKARFKDWHENTKSEIEITNKTATLSDEELDEKIAILRSKK